MEPGMAPVVRKGRPGVIVLIAFVVEFVVIVALANQSVTKHLVNFVADHNDRFAGHLVAAFTTYQWRFAAQPGDRANEPLAHACLNLVVLGLTALLVLAICRGGVTFGRVFFGTWMAVVVSTLVGQIVLDLVSPPPYPPGFSHVSGAVFIGPNGFGFIGGLMLGLVTAIFAAIFAVATRRTIRLAAYVEQPGEEEYSGPEWWEQTLAYPRADYPPAGYPPGYEQGYRPPYGPRDDHPDPRRDREEQVGAGAAEAGSEDPGEDTQQMPVVPEEPEEEEPQAPRSDDQPTEAIAPVDGTQESEHSPVHEQVSEHPGQREG